MNTTNPNNSINPVSLNHPPARWPRPQTSGAHAHSAFYGEFPAAATLQAMARQARNVNVRLMRLSPENWAAVQDSDELSELAAAVDELKITVAAMKGDPPSAGTATCLPAQVREMLREYRRRLQFLAVNLQLSDPGSRELLTEILNFDRWQAAHRTRCQQCRGPR